MTKLSETQICLRLVRGAHECQASWPELIKALEDYERDRNLIDQQPLIGWFNLGGADCERERR